MFFTENKLLCKEQHGFVPRKSCTTNLLESIDVLTNILSKMMNADLVFLDFSKAFDKMHHPSLVYKLFQYGITCNLIKWICSFLTNRRQRELMGDEMSDWLQVNSRVPKARFSEQRFLQYSTKSKFI